MITRLYESAAWGLTPRNRRLPGTWQTVFALLVSTGLSMAETYWVSPEGDDAWSGRTTAPWRTIQHAANVMGPGHTAIIREGTYEERVQTVRPGLGEGERIRFVADGAVLVRGWVVAHGFVSIVGFEISGWSGPTTASAHVEVRREGGHFEMSNCVVRDGIQIIRTDMVFDAQSGTISSSTGGFLSAGFAPGQTVYVGAAAPRLNVANSGTHTILAVTDDAITVGSELVEDGPLPIYLSASFVYGLRILPGASNCVIRSSVFRNLGFDAWFIMGDGHLLEDNIIEEVNGWDAMHFGGSDHVFHRNIIRNSPLRVYQVSPDALENYSPAPYTNVVFTNNFITGFDGVMASQKGSDHSTDLVLTRNVFVDVGRLNLTHPRTIIENNTFLRVAKLNNPVVSVARHPILVNTVVGAVDTVIRNNIFVDCGQASGSTTLDQVGWYEINGSPDTVVVEGNFVAGAPPLFPAKTGWSEDNPLLNGGDPGFVNLDDPLGSDGLVFTADDGLRLRPDSKLRLAGVGSIDLGAYAVTVAAPVLELVVDSDGLLALTWVDPDKQWRLESTVEPRGPWEESDASVLEGEAGRRIVLIEPQHGVALFRLAR